MEWISVKDRLPEKYGAYPVLVRRPDRKGSRCLYLGYWEETFTTKLKRWNLRNCGSYESIKKWNDCVDYWMPLPEPPNE